EPSASCSTYSSSTAVICTCARRAAGNTETRSRLVLIFSSRTDDRVGSGRVFGHNALHAIMAADAGQYLLHLVGERAVAMRGEPEQGFFHAERELLHVLVVQRPYLEQLRHLPQERDHV
ncbi:jg23360, partial [Pararge aegeria aegeria]